MDADPHGRYQPGIRHPYRICRKRYDWSLQLDRYRQYRRYGSFAWRLGSLGIGRQRDDIRAVAALEAPFMYDIVGVENDAFVFIDAVYPTPVLNIYSDDSWEYLSEWAQYAGNSALLSDPVATAFNVHVSGAGHLALTDLSLSSPFLVRLLDRAPLTRDSTETLHLINSLSLEFFDHLLKNQGSLQDIKLILIPENVRKQQSPCFVPAGSPGSEMSMIAAHRSADFPIQHLAGEGKPDKEPLIQVNRNPMNHSIRKKVRNENSTANDNQKHSNPS